MYNFMVEALALVKNVLKQAIKKVKTYLASIQINLRIILSRLVWAHYIISNNPIPKVWASMQSNPTFEGGVEGKC